MLLASRGAWSRRRAAKPASASPRRCTRPVTASTQDRQWSPVPPVPAGAAQALAAAEAWREARTVATRRDARAVLVAVLRSVCDALLSAGGVRFPRRRAILRTEPGCGCVLRSRGLVPGPARSRAGARRLSKGDRAVRRTGARAGGADFARSPLTKKGRGARGECCEVLTHYLWGEPVESTPTGCMIPPSRRFG